MNDQELLRWARECVKVGGDCTGCPFDGEPIPDDYSCTARLVFALTTRVEKLGEHCARYAEMLAKFQELCGLDRLREFAKADKAGRLVVLPIAPHEEVWVGHRQYRQRPYQSYYDSALEILNDMEEGFVFGATCEEVERALKEAEK